MNSIENKNFNDNRKIKNTFEQVISYQKYNIFKV